VNPPLPSPIVTAEGWLPYGKMLSFFGTGNELIRSPFNVDVTVPPKRMVKIAGGTALAGAPLQLSWSGFEGQGHVTLKVASSSITTEVICTAVDDGSFTVDASHLSAYSSGMKINATISDEDIEEFTAAGLTSGRATASITYTSGSVLIE
jgi:hypothetical protein